MPLPLRSHMIRFTIRSNTSLRDSCTGTSHACWCLDSPLRGAPRTSLHPGSDGIEEKSEHQIEAIPSLVPRLFLATASAVAIQGPREYTSAGCGAALRAARLLLAVRLGCTLDRPGRCKKPRIGGSPARRRSLAGSGTSQDRAASRHAPSVSGTAEDPGPVPCRAMPGPSLPVDPCAPRAAPPREGGRAKAQRTRARIRAKPRGNAVKRCMAVAGQADSLAREDHGVASSRHRMARQHRSLASCRGFSERPRPSAELPFVQAEQPSIAPESATVSVCAPIGRG